MGAAAGIAPSINAASESSVRYFSINWRNVMLILKVCFNWIEICVSDSESRPNSIKGAEPSASARSTPDVSSSIVRNCASSAGTRLWAVVVFIDCSMGFAGSAKAGGSDNGIEGEEEMGAAGCCCRGNTDGTGNTIGAGSASSQKRCRSNG